MADNTGLYGSTGLSNFVSKKRPLAATLYDSSTGIGQQQSSKTPSASGIPAAAGVSSADGKIDWDKWVEEQYAAQQADLVRKNQELANAAGIASSGVAVDTTTRALQDLRSSLTNTAMTNKYSQQLQKQAEDAAYKNLQEQLGSQASLQSSQLAAQEKLQQEQLAQQTAQAELNRQLESSEAEKTRKSQEKIAEESSPSALSSVASAVGGAGTMYALSQLGKDSSSAANVADALRGTAPEGTFWVDSADGGRQLAYFDKASGSVKFATGPGVSVPATVPQTNAAFGSNMTSAQRGGLGALSTLAGAGLGSIVGGNQERAWSGGGLAGSALGGLGGYFAAPALFGGGLTSSLVGAGLGGLAGNILGRQIFKF